PRQVWFAPVSGTDAGEVVLRALTHDPEALFFAGLAPSADLGPATDIGDGRQRARAKAGTALCLERDGADARAGDLIAGARLDDPAIDAWLASERARTGE
ncbi:MAG: hypothetical protein IAG13_02580, partial [Deltaproteobacteria bacterium]|nr:hypothetical protein [Nannocystaceae bacterium]